MPLSAAEMRCQLRFEILPDAQPGEFLAAWLTWEATQVKYIVIVEARELRIVKSLGNTLSLLLVRRITLEVGVTYWLGMTLLPCLGGIPLQVIAAIWVDTPVVGLRDAPAVSWPSYRVVALDPPFTSHKRGVASQLPQGGIAEREQLHKNAETWDPAWGAGNSGFQVPPEAGSVSDDGTVWTVMR